jgi:hypothetical protein
VQPDERSALHARTHDDLVLQLLVGALEVSRLVDQLHRLASLNADADAVSAGKLADAIAIMSEVRAGLIRDADRLTATRSP